MLGTQTPSPVLRGWWGCSTPSHCRCPMMRGMWNEPRGRMAVGSGVAGGYQVGFSLGRSFCFPHQSTWLPLMQRVLQNPQWDWQLVGSAVTQPCTQRMSEADISQRPSPLLMARLITAPCPLRVQLSGDPLAPAQAGPSLPQCHWGRAGSSGSPWYVRPTLSLCAQLGVEMQLLLKTGLLLQSRSRTRHKSTRAFDFLPLPCQQLWLGGDTSLGLGTSWESPRTTLWIGCGDRVYRDPQGVQ